MELSISNLLASFADDKLVAPKVLEKKLDCEDPANLHQLHIALDALERIGLLAKERGKYRRIEEEGLVEGRLRCSSKGFCFAIQDDEDTEDIYIRESQLNTAWNGDRVLVKVTKEGRRRRSPEGEVRLILERANPSVIARIKKTEAGYRAVPLDDRLLFELELEPSPAVPDLEAGVDQLVHVEIRRYPLGQYPPIGQVTQILGSDAQSAADTELVCCKHDLPRTFAASVLKAAENLPTKVRKADTKKRLDLRELFTVSINVLNLDLQSDHALSLTQTEAGWRLGLHIADIAYYVEPTLPLDREASKRGSAIALGGMVVPLLPSQISERLGVMVPGQDRLALSLLVTLNAAGEIEEYEIQPAVIQVDFQLTEAQVQAILDRHQTGVAADLESLAPTFELVDQLQSLSQILGQRRRDRGAFDLILPDNFPRTTADEGLLGAVVVSPVWAARGMVAEFLVLANQLVAAHLEALGAPAIYRTQAAPDVYDAQELIKLAGNLGIQLSLAQEDIVQAQDYQGFIQAFLQSDLAPILIKLLTATLKPATYSATSGPHFGMALLQGYGPLISPLNRYADLLNQRVLQALFEQGRDRRTTRARERVNLHHSSAHGQISWNVLPPELQRDLEAAIAVAIPHLNERERVIQQAKQDLEGLQKAKKMQERTGEIFRGLITGIQSYGFFVEIED